MEASEIKQRLPNTDSIRELAEFWNSHDITDFEDELEEVRGPLFVPRNPLILSLSDEEAQRLKEWARSQGVAASDLVHEWIRERIRAG